MGRVTGVPPGMLKGAEGAGLWLVAASTRPMAGARWAMGKWGVVDERVAVVEWGIWSGTSILLMAG